MAIPLSVYRQDNDQQRHHKQQKQARQDFHHASPGGKVCEREGLSQYPYPAHPIRKITAFLQTLYKPANSSTAFFAN